MKRLAALAAATAASAPLAALPCSPAWSLDRRAPTSTSTVIPANTLMQFMGPVSGSGLVADIILPGGATITATVTEVLDTGPWSLNDLYQVALPPVAMGAALTVHVDDGVGTTRDFVVQPNAPADTTPPTLGGALALTAEYHPENARATCIPAAHFTIRARFDPGMDDVEVANYTMFETTGGVMQALATVPAQPLFGGVTEGMTTYAPAAPLGQRCFALIARDLAGNESAPLTACVQATMAGAPDAGPGLDAGTMDGGLGGGAPDDDLELESCTCHRAPQSSLPFGFAGLGLLLGVARRRRK